MSAALTAVKPIEITQTMLVSTNVPEDDHVVWSPDTTYAAGVRAIKDRLIYESLEAGNVGNDPVLSPLKWVEVESTNRWRAFDGAVNTQTKQASGITYRIKPGQSFTTVAALNVSGATSVTVRVYQGGALVKTVTAGLWLNAQAAGWWNWWFGMRHRATQAIVEGLPGIPSAEVELEFVGGPDLAVGAILMGRERSFGLGVLQGAQVSNKDYSVEREDEWGALRVVKRDYAKRARFTLLVPARELDEFQRFIAELRSTPCLLIASRRFESLTVYGLLRSSSAVIAYYDYTEFDIELRGFV